MVIIPLGNQSSFTQVVKQFVDDNAHTLTDLPLIFSSVDIQILDNDGKFGDRSNQEFVITANNVVSYRNQINGVDIQQIFFKNKTAGQNIKVVANGVLL